MVRPVKEFVIGVGLLFSLLKVDDEKAPKPRIEQGTLTLSPVSSIILYKLTLSVVTFSSQSPSRG